MSIMQYSTRATNMQCHNMCDPSSLMPLGVKSLLGLGLKYCVRTPRPTNKIKNTIDRLKRNLRLMWYFKYHPPDEVDEDGPAYIPGLYIPNKNWDPPECDDLALEKGITKFKLDLQKTRKQYDRSTISNLTPRQWKLATTLKNDDNLICVEGDKNVGGCLLRRNIYNYRGIKEHLGDTTVYKPLTKRQATQHLHILRYKYDVFIAKWKGREQLSKAEWTYLRRAKEETPYNFARFRMSLKAHKNPWKMRPIVCCVGTFMNNLSCWLDHWLQKLRPFIPSYLKDGNQLLTIFNSLGLLPPGSLLFIADATSMYTNMHTGHAILVITEWLRSLQHRLPTGFPLDAIIEAMTLVMTNNIFEWGDMYFLQLLGTAMGTSSACMWATIYFAVHENNTLLVNFNNHLLIYKRFIDDIFGIWIPASVPNIQTDFESFKATTNNFGILKWEFEELSTSVNFLDLTISIENNKIVTRTYQKPINLYQYIMPQSCHPPGMAKGIITSLLRNYYRQNTKTTDYEIMAKHLFYQWVARGWTRTAMRNYILEADLKVRRERQQQITSAATAPPELNNKERLFIHWEYHQCDIPKREIRAIYNLHLKELVEKWLDVKQTTVCYSRPKNIRDYVTKAKLHQAPGREISKFYTGELTDG